MKVYVTVSGCFPVLRGLDTQQFINAIEPRLIDIRSPVTGLQIDMFGRVSAVHLDADKQSESDTIAVEIDIDDTFVDKHKLSQQQVRDVVAARISKLRHPGTGAMTPVTAQLSNG